MGLTTFEQLGFELDQLRVANLRRSPRSTGAAQTVSAKSTPRGTPVRDNLMRDAQLSRNLGWNDASLEQVRGAHTSVLHRR
jgi:hypothetical protein